MTRPASPAEFGTVLPTPRPTPGKRPHRRFRDVRAHLDGTLPRVQVGEVYADLNPRSNGRLLQVLRVCQDDTVVVHTIATRDGLNPPRVGPVRRIARSRMRPNSRGYERVGLAPRRGVEVFVLANRIAAACDAALTVAEIRVADALIGLLGPAGAEALVAEALPGRDQQDDPARAAVGLLDRAARRFLEGRSTEDPGDQPVAPRHVVRRIAALT